MLVAYPVHGPGLGKNPRKLARYDVYDALAPELRIYKTIKKLILSERG